MAAAIAGSWRVTPSHLAGYCRLVLLDLAFAAGLMGSGRPPGSLRGELTEFVGRQAELALIRQTLGEAQRVTLTRPEGMMFSFNIARRQGPAK